MQNLNENLKQEPNTATQAPRVKYECKVYLGKELYNTLLVMAQYTGLNLSQTIRLVLNLGLSISKEFEKRGKING